MKQLILLLPILFYACNRKTATSATTNPEPPKVELPAEEPTVSSPISSGIEPLEALPQAVLAMQKTPCYGKCPVYEARFMSDGRVTWYGKKNTDRVGHYEAFINENDLEQLREHIKNSQFQNFAPTYPTNADKIITDLPQTITKVQLNGQVLQVTNNHDAPQPLRELERLVEMELDKLIWRKIE